MIRDLICKRCLIKIGEEETVKTNTPRKIKLCQECKNKSLKENNKKLLKRNKSKKLRDINSNRMKQNNPMFKEEVRKKVSETTAKLFKEGKLKSVFSDPEKLKKIKQKWEITDSGRKSISDRMKTSNPMHNKEIAKKAHKSLKESIKNGKYIPKNGPEHHLWKGNRIFNDLCRQLLYKPWTKKILDRDNYTCTECGKTKKLQVHHIKPLRNFIKYIKRKYNIKEPLDHLDDKTRYKLAQEIVSRHKLKDGITICQQCHNKIDKHYHFKEKNED